jgi:uncharacterized repeat protein (TIGR03803 family)
MRIFGSGRFFHRLTHKGSHFLAAVLITALLPAGQPDAEARSLPAADISAAVPHGKLIQAANGGFYGVTSSIDTNLGTVFYIAPAASAEYSLLHSFSGQDGAYPTARLALGSAGNVYGTTRFGGSSFSGDTSGAGTLYRVTPSGEHTVLHEFSGPDGTDPIAGLVQGSDGNFYGITNRGGSSDAGTVFRLTQSGEYTLLHSFSGADGSLPTYLAIGRDGNFYGTTFAGGSSDRGVGTVFRIAPSGEHTVLHSFSGPDGEEPNFLVQGSDDNFYGLASRGGDAPASAGTVFRITPAGEFSRLHSFRGSNDGIIAPLPESEREGAQPTKLVQSSDGDFYGITYSGGDPFAGNQSGAGTAFRITASGAYSQLHKFSYGTGTSGGFPTDLVQGSDGNYYGTAQYGGSADLGTIFRLTPSGEYADLHSFTGSDGVFPVELVHSSDGNFYGTTARSGDEGPFSGAGTVFRVTPAGELTTLQASAPLPTPPPEVGPGSGGSLDAGLLMTLALLLLLRLVHQQSTARFIERSR